jgi:hypothetical protein
VGVVSSVPGGETVHIKVDAVHAAANGLRAAGEAVAAAAGGVDRALPVVPEDPHDLSEWCVRFDEARERFDRRLAEQLVRAGDQLATQADATTAVDSLKAFPGW